MSSVKEFFYWSILAAIIVIDFFIVIPVFFPAGEAGVTPLAFGWMPQWFYRVVVLAMIDSALLIVLYLFYTPGPKMTPEEEQTMIKNL